MSTITVTGPFTTAEIRRVVALMQDIESMRPTEFFAIHADVSDIEGDGEQIFAQMDPPPLPGYAREQACSDIEHHYRLIWDLADAPADAVKEMLFDGADAVTRARALLEGLRVGEKRGMCSNIVIAHRVASIFRGPWQTVQEVDQ